MSLSLIVFAGCYLLYAMLILIVFRRILNGQLAYLKQPPVNFLNTCRSAARYDFIHLKKLEIYLGAVFLLPIRFVMALILIIVVCVLQLILKLCFCVTMKNNGSPRGRIYVWLVMLPFKLIRPILFFFGFIRVKTIKLSLKEVLADYDTEKYKCKGRAPLVVSNHCSWADMFFYLMKPVSFLSKKAVASIPGIGIHAINRQSIFLDREDKGDRDMVLNKIQERAELVKESNGSILPLLIFPEGTISNGRCLLSFKKGAFVSGEPLKIYTIKYNTDDRVVNSMINIPAFSSFLLTISAFYNEITLFEYKEAFDPRYLADKYGLSKEDPNAWEKTAAQVKELMQFCSGFQSTDDTYRQTLEFEKQSLEF